MNNFDHAADATATSINSAGSAMKENEAYQSSLEYQTNELKAEFQDLANNVIDKQLITSVLGLGEAFLKLANTGVGQFITKVGLLGGTSWGLSSLLKVSNLIPTITKQFSDFGAVISLVAEGSGTFGEAIAAAGGAASVALPIFLAVSAAIVGIVAAIDYFSTIDTRKLENLSSTLQETQDKISEMTASGSEYDTLIQNADKLTEVEKTRLGVLQAQLDTLKAQAGEQENAYLTEWQRQQTKTKTDVIVEQRTRMDGDIYYATTGTVEYTEAQRATESLIDAVSELTQKKYAARIGDAEYLAGLQDILDTNKEQYDNLVRLNEIYEQTGDEAVKLSEDQEEWLAVYEHQSDIVDELGKQYAEISDDINELSNATEDAVVTFEQYNEILTNYKEATTGASGAAEKFVTSLFNTNGELTEAAKQALTTNSAMANMASAFIQAQQAQSETNFSNLIAQIQAVGQAAMITSAQIANMMAAAGVGIGAGGDAELSKNLQRTYQETTHKTVASDPEAYKTWLQNKAYSIGQEKYQREQKELAEQLQQISTYVSTDTKGAGDGGGSSSTKKDQEEVKSQTINTIEELREYLTDESTRLKLIDPDISKSDLESTLSEVATIYQSYQDYLSQLKQQGFDETSEQYKQAEAEFAQFMAVLEELFNQIAQKGNYTIEELYQKLQSALGDVEDLVSSTASSISSSVESVYDSMINKIKQGQKMMTTGLQGVFEAVRGGAATAEDAIAAIEGSRDAINAEYEYAHEQYKQAVQDALDNAAVEKDVAQEVADEYDRQNSLLEDKIYLEEKLEALEKAKQRRMLVYSEGRFQYMQDVDAISGAQADYQEAHRTVEEKQKQDLLDMLGDKSAEFFSSYFSKENADVLGYGSALQSYLMSYLGENIKGSLFEGMSDQGLYDIFGEAMKPGEAYSAILQAYMAEQEAAKKAAEKKAQRKKEIREENVKYWGVDTDFGEKIKNAQSQAEAAYWADLRDAKLEMIKDYREAYGDEAASKYFGTDVSQADTWKSNKDIYKEAWTSGNTGYATSTSDFERQHLFNNDEQYRYTVENPDLEAAKYNVASGLTFEGYKDADQRLYNRIFSGSITKDELQKLYDDKSLSDVTKGYILNLASELKKSGAQGYARGTRGANGGLSLVGENGPELRVLNQGDGILPNGITDNLWRWGSMTPTDMLSSLAQQAQSWMQTLNIDNVTLPNVRDAQSFVSGLRELAQQYVTRRN